MAIQSLPNKQAPSVFYGNDESVYMSQALAVADLLATGNHDQCAPKTVNEAGALIWTLLSAAEELAEAERAERRAKLAAVQA